MINPNNAASIGVGSGARSNTRAVGVTGSMVYHFNKYNLLKHYIII